MTSLGYNRTTQKAELMTPENKADLIVVFPGGLRLPSQPAGAYGRQTSQLDGALSQREQSQESAGGLMWGTNVALYAE